MLSMILKGLFGLSAIILTGTTVYGKMFVFRKKKPQFVSDYVAMIALFMSVYVLSALALIFVLPAVHAKLMMFVFAILPFIIGYLATFNTEKYYTAFQILVYLISIGYII